MDMPVERITARINAIKKQIETADIATYNPDNYQNAKIMTLIGSADEKDQQLAILACKKLGQTVTDSFLFLKTIEILEQPEQAVQLYLAPYLRFYMENHYKKENATMESFMEKIVKNTRSAIDIPTSEKNQRSMEITLTFCNPDFLEKVNVYVDSLQEADLDTICNTFLIFSAPHEPNLEGAFAEKCSELMALQDKTLKIALIGSAKTAVTKLLTNNVDSYLGNQYEEAQRNRLFQPAPPPAQPADSNCGKCCTII